MGRNKDRRAQRELDILSGAVTESPRGDGGTSEDENIDEALISLKPQASGFAALAQPDIGVSDNEEGDLEETTTIKNRPKHRKKKKKAGAASLAAGAQPASEQISQLTPQKKKKGKAKANEIDDLDKALSELSLKYPDLEQVAQSSSAGLMETQTLAARQSALLCVSLANLDSEAEMRKFFGSKVISASKAQEKLPRGARVALKSLKSNLTKPQPNWWSASQREGLTIRLLSANEITAKRNRRGIKVEQKGDRWWSVEYSKRYRSVTKAFWEAVLSGDPERFYRIISKLPWHADTLLQLSEVYRHREEYSTAVDFLNRALFTYERSFIGAFAITAGNNRLDFDRVENRPFYLAVSRMVSDLQRRGCYRTSFEFARLLWSLDPYTDPHGALLFLDLLSIRSGMHDWLLSVWDVHEAAIEKSGGESHSCEFNVTKLPGWAYARALALRAQEDTNKNKDKNHLKSTAALEQAIRTFPSVAPLLADKVDVFLPSEIKGHTDFRVHADASQLPHGASLIHLLSHLYAHRSSSMWKIPENAEWLKVTTLSVFKTYNSMSNTLFSQNPFDPDLSRSVYRHINVLTDVNEVRRLTAFFPREIVQAPSLSCDPLPPLTSESEYNGRFFDGCEDIFAFRPRTRRERDQDARQLARMIPDANIRQHIQVIYDNRPDLQRQFPDGVVQFAHFAAQMDEDFWDNLFMPGGDAAVQLPEGAMPGGFEDDNEGALEEEVQQQQDDNENDATDAREDGEHNAEDSPSDDDDEPVPAFPARVWQNLVNRFWGANPE